MIDLPSPRVTTVPAKVAMTGVPFYALTVGLWIIGSDPIRWGGPSFTILREIPFGMMTWGYWAVAAGLLTALGLMFGHWRSRAAGLFLMSLWSGAFGVCALLTAITVPTAAPTGGPTYLVLAFFIGNLILYREPSS